MKTATYIYHTDIAAGWDWGRIKKTTIKTIDFELGVIRWTCKGVHEGDRVDLRGEDLIPAGCIPERVDDYHRATGWIRDDSKEISR